MKIVLVNKFLYPRGGDCLYTLRLMELLQNKGQSIIPFSMCHPSNPITGYEIYHVPYIDFNDELKNFSLTNAFKVISRSIINTRAARLMSKLIDDLKPDIVHLQNIHHQLTPAIVLAAAERNVPIVWTMHDYILNCPNDNFFCHGRICTRCARGNNVHAVIHRCKKGSLAASLLAAFECTLYNPKRLANYVFRFICPSHFMAEMLYRNGMPTEKVAVVPNFLVPVEIPSTGDDYFLYSGRLAPEKGVDTLLEAFKDIDKPKLLIAGEGPQRNFLQNRAEQLGIKNVRFLGHRTPQEIQRLLAGCRAAIVPSVCYENLPYAIMEAMAAGKPVIASRIGGIPEMVEHEVTGLLFDPGNPDELAEMLDRISNDKKGAALMGQAGKNKVRRFYSADRHYELLKEIYDQAGGFRAMEKMNHSADDESAIAEEMIGNKKG